MARTPKAEAPKRFPTPLAKRAATALQEATKAKATSRTAAAVAGCAGGVVVTGAIELAEEVGYTETIKEVFLVCLLMNTIT
jgi:uncharacterized membrane protein YdcZ (DUF606 family)